MLVAVASEKIRNVCLSDLDNILTIEKSCYHQPWTYEMFAQELNNPVSHFICYVENGNICGYLCYWYVAGEIEILNLATALNMQRQGVARLLLDFAFSVATSSGLSSAFLEVRSGNTAAVKLYKKVGFLQTGVRQRYYRDGEDAILMAKTFTV